MAVGWFICPMKLRETMNAFGRPIRYCGMDDFSQQIISVDGGAWTETEVLGNHALVKVRATAETLASIAGTAGFVRIPASRLDDPLSSLTVAQRNAIRNKIESLGYSSEELIADLGSNIRQKTLGDVLRFVAKRRRKPRWDSINQVVVLDGPEQPVRPVESVDAGVV